jgi:hypothetical protein
MVASLTLPLGVALLVSLREAHMLLGLWRLPSAFARHVALEFHANTLFWAGTLGCIALLDRSEFSLFFVSFSVATVVWIRVALRGQRGRDSGVLAEASVTLERDGLFVPGGLDQMFDPPKLLWLIAACWVLWLLVVVWRSTLEIGVAATDWSTWLPLMQAVATAVLWMDLTYDVQPVRQTFRYYYAIFHVQPNHVIVVCLLGAVLYHVQLGSAAALVFPGFTLLAAASIVAYNFTRDATSPMMPFPMGLTNEYSSRSDSWSWIVLGIHLVMFSSLIFVHV